MNQPGDRVTAVAKILARRAVDAEADDEKVWADLGEDSREAFRRQAAELLGEINLTLGL
jgi:hypothetical protein